MTGTAANLAGLLVGAAQDDPDGTALIFGSERLSWQALHARALAVAGGLLDAGGSRGDRVALLLGNTPAFPAAYFGVLLAGLVAVPVNPGLTAPELDHILTDCRPTVVLTDAAHRDHAALAQAGEATATTVVDVDSLLQGATSNAGPTLENAGGGEDLAVVSYTSGTSGRPRGAMLSHRALLANLDQLARVEPPVAGPTDVVLLVLPLFHIYALNVGLGFAVRQRATCVLAERFEPVESLELLRAHDVTLVVGAPPMFVAWSMLPAAEVAFATVRLAISGAAPLPAAVASRMLETTGHHVFEGYGLTETAPILTTTLRSEAAKPGSIGRALPGVELRLGGVGGAPSDDLGDDEDDDDALAAGPTGEVGVISARGDNLFSGYWPGGEGGPDDEGWWSTGDVAFRDDDGDFHLVDRLRELILVSGFNVYPREVEDVLDRHPDVVESAVLGIPHPYTGQSVKAFVVLRDGADISGASLIDFAAASLARFKCPTTVQVVQALPHTSTGKVSKGRLRELARETG